MVILVLRWFLLGIGALSSGAQFVQSLTAHPVKMGRYQWATATSLLGAWNDDPWFIQAIEEKILALNSEGGGETDAP